MASIEELAYALWEARGRQLGDDRADWFAAEAVHRLGAGRGPAGRGDPRAEIKQVLIEAVDELLARDVELLGRDVNERSITHRLAIYIERRLADEWDVDCEYNRDFDDAKRLDLPPRAQPTSDDIHARTVFPDIIVHKRAPKDQRNLLVIEVKKTTNPEGDLWDHTKLDRFREQFGYEVVAFVKLTAHNPNRVRRNDRKVGALIDFRDGSAREPRGENPPDGEFGARGG